MKKSLFTLAFVLVAFLAMNTAQAQNAHFTDIVVDGLSVSGKVAGLGNSSGLVTITYSAHGTIDRKCSNAGQSDIPGLRLSGDINASDTYMATRNGQVSFNLTLDADDIYGEIADCPGNNITNIVISLLGKSLSFTTASGSSGSIQFP